MAFPFLHAVGTVLSGAAGITYAWPSGHQTNDIGFLVIESDGVATAAAATGFVHVTGSPLADVASVAGSKFQILWMRATSAAMPNVTVADLGDHQIGCIAVYRSCVTTGNPWEALASGVKATASTTVTLPTVTTLGIDRLIAFFASQPADSNSATEFGVPVNAALTSITEHREDAINVGNGGAYQIASGRKAAAGATGTTAITLATAATNVMFTLALIPSNPNDGVAPMTGTASTTGTGTIVGRGSASGALTGTASTTGTGTITATGGMISTNGTANLTGTGSVAATGAITASGAASAPVNGTSSATATGAVTATGEASSSLSGTGSATATGALTAAGAASAALTGSALATQTGTLTASGNAEAPLTGTASTVQTGSIAASAGAGNAAATLTGTASTTLTGTLTGRGNADALMTGAQASVAFGIVIGKGNATVLLAGSASTVSTGSITAVGGGGYLVSPDRAALIYQIALLHGLDPANPLTIPKGDGVRQAGGVMQTISGAGPTTVTTTVTTPFAGDLDAWIDALAAEIGLTAPLQVTPTGLTAGSLSQVFAETSTAITVTRVS